MKTRQLASDVFLLIGILLQVMLVSTMPARAVVHVETRALSGDPAPGTTGVYDAVGFTGQPQIDDSGRIAFAGRLSIGTGGVTWDNYPASGPKDRAH